MYNRDFHIPPTVAMDPGFLSAVGLRNGTEWLNGGTFAPKDTQGNITEYRNAKDNEIICNHVKRLIAATDWLMDTYHPLCNIPVSNFVIAVEMFEGVGGVSGVVTSRIAHQYYGYYLGKGYHVIAVVPRKAGGLHQSTRGGDMSWKRAYTTRLCGKRPKYAASNHLGEKVLMLPNDSPSNLRRHEQATDDIAVYANIDPLKEKLQAVA